ncbi:hypothetical protein GX51_01660 [Blastomyces parvus]|uniref:Uncharacterized protein n=1 Tax=Blastomyces parvus TaxID=2060905 RepID=A0A2B7XFV5_9EURO|nr:hypothetical protein GX51_01660 [Blastomyces parvus]
MENLAAITRPILGSGKCTASLLTGELRRPCPCSNGKFEVPVSSGYICCKTCSHTLAEHDAFQHAEIPSPSQAISSHNLPLQNLQHHNLRHAENNTGTTEPTGSISTRLSRKEVVRALWQRLKEKGVVHVQGPPASGKSTLAHLLRLHVENTSEMQVVSLSWPKYFPGNFSTMARYYRLLNAITGRQLDLDDWRGKRVLLIVDEAQRSYACTSFWNDLIRFVTPGAGPCVALFSSYGSPSRCPSGRQVTTPVIFHPAQQISLRRTSINPDIGLYFSRKEYDELVHVVCLYHRQQGNEMVLPHRLTACLWDLTSGHPGAHGRSVESIVRTVWECLSYDGFVLACIASGPMRGILRSLPAENFRAKISNVSRCLAEAVVNSGLVASARFKSEIDMCYREGWLQAEHEEGGKKIYIFPSCIHQRLFEDILSRNIGPFPFDRYKSIEGLSFSILNYFDPDRLKAHSNSLLFPRRLKAYFRNAFYYEFYYACYKLFGEQKLYLASGWTGELKARRADFQVRGTRWAIEIITEEDDVDECVARFKDGGRYSGWLKSQGIQQYLILDCRTSRPDKMAGKKPVDTY